MAARTNYAGVPGRAPGNQKRKNGKPIFISGKMGLIDVYIVIANIAEIAAEQFGSIAWEFKHGEQEADEDVDVGTVMEKTEKRQRKNSRKDLRDRMIQYVCKH